MAIFRAETKSLSRGKGHNLAAAISYRAGIKLTDNNTINPKARSYDYTQKTDVIHSEILLPKNLRAQLDESDIELDFQSIADLVEIGETTKRGKMKNSARLAREWVLCGVPELTRAENIELFEQFAQQQSEEQGVLSMVFVHDPTAGDDMATTKAAAEGKKMGNPDPRNIHAHILLLTRELDVSSDSQLSLGKKSDSELSNDERIRPIVPKGLVGTIDPETGKKIQQGRGLCSNSDWLKNTRKQWADLLNERLEQKGVQPVTHKSYKDLGLKFKPTKHLGKNATVLGRMGIETEIGKYNESINRDNRSHLEFAAERLAGATEQGVDISQQRVESVARSIADSERQVDDNQQRTEHHKRQEEQVNRIIENSTRRTAPTRPNPFDDAARRARNSRIDEQERRFDTETDRNRYADERTAESTRRLKLSMAMTLLSRHHENNALQTDWETVEECPDKFDRRQIQYLDEFAQIIGADGKITDFVADSRRIAELFTGEVIEQHKNIIQILRKPASEREQYNNYSPKSLISAPQSDLNPLTRDNTGNNPKTSNTANESVSVSPRRGNP